MAGMIITFFFLILNTAFQPYCTPNLSKTQACVLIAQFISLFSGSCLIVESYIQKERIRAGQPITTNQNSSVFEVLIVGINLIVCAWPWTLIFMSGEFTEKFEAFSAKLKSTLNQQSRPCSELETIHGKELVSDLIISQGDGCMQKKIGEEHHQTLLDQQPAHDDDGSLYGQVELYLRSPCPVTADPYHPVASVLHRPEKLQTTCPVTVDSESPHPFVSFLWGPEKLQTTCPETDNPVLKEVTTNFEPLSRACFGLDMHADSGAGISTTFTGFTPQGRHSDGCTPDAGP
jgi:hypothetical protein